MDYPSPPALRPVVKQSVKDSAAGDNKWKPPDNIGDG